MIAQVYAKLWAQLSPCGLIELTQPSFYQSLLSSSERSRSDFGAEGSSPAFRLLMWRSPTPSDQSAVSLWLFQQVRQEDRLSQTYCSCSFVFLSWPGRVHSSWTGFASPLFYLPSCRLKLFWVTCHWILLASWICEWECKLGKVPARSVHCNLKRMLPVFS